MLPRDKIWVRFMILWKIWMEVGLRFQLCRRYDRICRRSGCRRSTRRWRSIVTGRWFIQMNTRTGDSVSASVCVFSPINKLLGRTEIRTRTLARGSAFSRYEQFEISPETIEQELRPVVCLHRQTDLRIIIGRKEGTCLFDIKT